ncbi:YrhB domain-containing protein [Ralstonia mannitolilytica]|uniref:YrhB domain-containing protein n=1 Tax=Ralstonia mannitolilytica TaxID=105219 RepID=UPI000C7D5CCD|nr:YrhB domain-containing protein [Ralstonia mannitolilytica]PLT18883.1 hypothetical protein CXP34_02495 [Ralstonia mannitolilytica]
MIDLQQAENVASHYLEELGREIGIPLTVVRRQDLPYGWVFFYNSKAYLESGEIGAMLAGNAPFVVDAFDGSLHVLGTAHPVDFYLKEYEAVRGQEKQ